MNLFTGEIVEIYAEGGITMGKVRVGGVLLRVPLKLLPESKVGDMILMGSGVALSIIETEKKET